MDPEQPSHTAETPVRRKMARGRKIKAPKTPQGAEEHSAAAAAIAPRDSPRVGEVSEHGRDEDARHRREDGPRDDATPFGRSQHVLDDSAGGTDVPRPAVKASSCPATSVGPGTGETGSLKEHAAPDAPHYHNPGAATLDGPSRLHMTGLTLSRTAARSSRSSTADGPRAGRGGNRVSPVMPSTELSAARSATGPDSGHRQAPQGHFQPIPVNPRPTLQPFAMVIIGAHITTSIGATLLMAVLFAKRSAPAGDVCQSHECREYAKLLLSSVDTTVSPCHNFTRFVCGRWERNSELSVRETLYVRAVERMRRHLFDIEVPSSGQNSVQRAAAVYRSCVNVLRGHADEVVSVKRALTEAGIAWPRHSDPADVDLVHTLLYASLRLGWDVILRLTPRLSEERTTLLVNPGRAFRHLVQRRPSEGAAFDTYFNTLRKAFGNGDHGEANVAETLLVEDIIRRNLTTSYSLRTPRQVLSEATYFPLAGHRWKAALSNLTLHVRNLEFVTTAHDYVVEFFSVWESMGETQAHYLTSWAVVQVAALYASRELIVNFHRGSARRAVAYHGAFCVGAAYAFSRRAVFLRYMEEVMRGSTRADAERVANHVVEALFRRLVSWPLYREGVQFVADWSALSRDLLGFDAEDRTPGIVGYDMTTDSFVENWRKSTLLPESASDSTVIEAIDSVALLALFHETRTFQLLPVALSFPIFDVSLVTAVNFGGLGGQVASALGQLLVEAYSTDDVGFDTVGRFRNMMVCVAAESSQLHAKATAAMAVTAAALFDAYVDDDPLPVLLPGLERFTGAQLLFVSLCFALCENGRIGSGICDAALRNVAAFADAFRCAPDAPMNPPERCQVP
ncbi:endothelin-converting enzyme-like 1 [Dermacentor albipictus]|uniref:endothelin-converting enzyme-like 1 n=1 Tax=Dermacentor albipictus TaxID=60249 RepID=UPI0031FD030D